MKRSIAVKALSAGLCITMGMSLAACSTPAKPAKDIGAEPTMEAKPAATSEVETETTVQTTESETTTTTEETTTETTLPLVNPYEEFISGDATLKVDTKGRKNIRNDVI